VIAKELAGFAVEITLPNGASDVTAALPSQRRRRFLPKETGGRGRPTNVRVATKQPSANYQCFRYQPSDNPIVETVYCAQRKTLSGAPTRAGAQTVRPGAKAGGWAWLDGSPASLG
jgi:hypothetical protein